MPARLLSNLVGLCAIACLAVGAGGLFGLWVALIVLGVLLAVVGYLLAQQETDVESPAVLEVKEAIEAALQQRQLQHELELAGAVSQAEERGREEIRQALAAQKRSEELADELERALI